MSRHFSGQAESRLFTLLAQLYDDTLTPSAESELQELVLSSEEMQRTYTRLSFIHAQLHHKYSSAGDIMRSLADEIMLVSVLPTARQSLWQRFSSFSPQSVLGVTLAVAAVFYGLFLAISWNIRGQAGFSLAQQPLAKSVIQNDLTLPAAPVAIATVSRQINCVWATPSLTTGEPLVAEQRYKLLTGMAEITYANHVKVVVQGPVTFEPYKVNQLRLHHGALAATVSPQGIGFTVSTQSAKVVDLGTIFQVTVNEAGQTDVQVVVGKVTVEPAEAEQGIAKQAVVQPVVLNAGQSAQVLRSTAGNVSITTGAPDPTAPRVVYKDAPQNLDGLTNGPRLIHHWTFDEGQGIEAKDSGKVPFSLHLKDGAAFVPGKRGTALYLDGVAGFADSPKIPFAADVEHTITFWARHDDPQPVKGAQVLLAWGQSARRYLLQVDNTSSKIAHITANQGRFAFAIGPGPFGKFKTTNALPSQGSWIHWALVRTRNQAILFRDGKLIEALSYPAASGGIDPDGGLFVGRQRAGVAMKDAAFFHGALDDLAMWRGTLSPEQVLNVMHQGPANFQQPLKSSKNHSPIKSTVAQIAMTEATSLLIDSASKGDAK